MRNFVSPLSAEVLGDLDRLTRPAGEVGTVAYREAMARLGQGFVKAYADRLRSIGRLLLVCTNEDADFLARGVLDGLNLAAIKTHVACFWNDREVFAGNRSAVTVDMAPIVRRYVEPGEVDAMLVVKSIISSACVVRTNISELIYDYQPSRVIVFAPVVLKGAEGRVAEEFDEHIQQRFEFFWFAEDDEKDGDNVRPGIGGQVYERLGIGTRQEKNDYVPALVKERRLLAQ